MAEAKAAPAVDTVHIKMPSQYKHLMANQQYHMTFGEVFTLRNDNLAAPKAEVTGPNAAAYMDFEKATLKRLKR